MAERDLQKKETLAVPQTDDKNSGMLSDMTSWAVEEFIKPKAKEFAHDTLTGLLNAAADAFLGIIDKKFYGDNYREHSSPRRSDAQKKNYGGYYNSKPKTSQPPVDLAKRSATYDIPIDVPTREWADRIRNSMIEEIVNYGKVKVGTLYELAKMETTSADWKWGWTHVEDIHYVLRGGRYVFDLPKPIPINNL